MSDEDAPRGGPRGSRAQVEERRRRVWMLAHVRNLAVGEIAQVVGAARRTVERDLTVVRQRTHDHLRRTGQLEEAVLDAASHVIANCDAVGRQAWGDLMEAAPGSATRARFLRTVMDSIVARYRILQSLGVVKRVPEEVLIGGTELERRLRGLSDDQAEQYLSILDGVVGGEGVPAADARTAAGAEGLDRGEPVDSG